MVEQQQRTQITRGCVYVLLSASLGVAGPECLNPGPDLIVRDIFDAYSYGSVGDRAAFAVGTDACNIGDVVHDWYGETSNHPVIDSALYRLHDGRFEQIGMAWLKHGFGAAQEDTCGCDCIPGDWEHLGVGCSDAYNAQTNGIQGICGSRLEVNPWTGVFPFPPSGWGASGDTVFRRLQASHSDLDPVVFVGAEYVTEAHYVAPADAAAGNQRNNYSTRSATFDYSGDRWNMSLHGETSVGQPAVRTWQAMDSEVVVTEVEGKTGRVLIGARVHAEPGGWYRYEYAVQNLDDARGVRAMVVPCNSAATILDPQFTDVDYHSDDPIVGTDWPVVLDADAIAWSTDTWLRDPQANAIRWGTTYSFGFRANIDPAEGEVQLTYFTTGSPASVMVSTLVPRLDAVDPCTLPSGSCPRDLNGDLMAGVDDLLIVLETWGQCGDGTWQPGGDVDQDCCVTVDDILELLVGWGEDCRPRGACCLVDGGCDGDVLEADCDAAGGTWRGVGVSCFDAGCPEPGGCCFGDASCVEDLLPDDCHAAGGLHLPSGAGCADCPLMADACIDAVPIGDGHHAFDTTGATTDGPVHLECDTFDGGVTGNDIWMRYASPADGVLVLSTCNTANYDSDLVVYDGVDCENLVLLGCNDDTEGCEGWTSYLEVPVLADGEYLVRLGGWQEDSTGTGCAGRHVRSGRNRSLLHAGGVLPRSRVRGRVCRGWWFMDG